MSRENFRPTFDRTGARETKMPRWINRFTNLITRSLHAAEPLAPVGCHVHLNDEANRPQWEVTLFLASTEILGGPRDGQVGLSRFMLDLHELLMVFDSTDSFYWQAQPMAEDDDLGPHIGVEGQFEGQSVWLRMTAEPPIQFQHGHEVDLSLNDRW